MTHKTGVNIKVPNLEDLCYINCNIDPIVLQDPIIKSLFHCQILTCRLIIYTVKCCIASPSVQNVGNVIHVIISKKFYKTGKIQAHLYNLKLQFTNPEPVHQKMYEACLKYSFTFKLAPHWNLIGKSYYLRGFEFLSLPSNIDAVEWRILFKDDDSKLEIIPMKINLSPLTLEFLKLPPSLIDNFKTNPNSTINSIDLTLFQCPWVYVLPNLTRARLISVSTTLPKSCSFDSYNDLRRHWKNMYSYRLPKTPQGLLFYEVVFPTFPNQHFTYPEICILDRKPEILMCENKNDVASEFIKNLSSSVESVCGEVIKIGRLHTELSVEYSCVLKKKNDEHNNYNTNESTSPFFTMSSGTTQPTINKLNIPPTFTFKGINKMSTSMKEHTLQISSIVSSQTQKQQTKRSQNQITWKSSNPRNEQKCCHDNTSQVNRGRTRIENINMEEVLSYHDLPSLTREESKCNNYCKSTQSSGKVDGKKSFSSNSFRFNREDARNSVLETNQPVIKKVENVAYDLSGFQKAKPVIKRNRSKKEQKSASNKHSLNSPSRENDFAEIDGPHEDTVDHIYQSNENIPNLTNQFESYMKSFGGPQNEKSQGNEMKNDPLVALFNKFNSYKMENQTNDTEASNDQCFKFDLSNKSADGALFQQEKPKTPEYSMREIIEKSSVKMSKSELKKVDINIFEKNVSSSKNPLKLFVREQKKKHMYKSNKTDENSYDYLRKSEYENFNEDELQRTSASNSCYKSYDTENASNFHYSQCSNFVSDEHLQSKEFESAINSFEIDNEINFQSPASLARGMDQQNEKSLPELNQGLNKYAFFRKETCSLVGTQSSSCSTEMFEDTMDAKLFGNSKSFFPKIDFNCSLNNIELSKDNDEPGKFNSDKNVVCEYYESQYSPSLLSTRNEQYGKSSPLNNSYDKNQDDNLSNIRLSRCKTPSLTSMFSFNGKQDDKYATKHFSQNMSPMIFESEDQKQNEMHSQRPNYQNLNQLENSNEENENDHKNFTSLLSESSDESDSNDYESYKEACAEALTFDNQLQ